ncbi:MAG: 3-hydroxyacyl-ACP dehydratase FabZ family protein [Planctomycetia bacterium]|nr:3-hydroxyacyl-ACP dehydratase FabZ family protein [Planctomycetia bacterium]
MRNVSSEIIRAIPHREPFLLIDTFVGDGDDFIECEKTFRSDEFFFAGHYPDYPLVPGVLLCEAAMQAGAVWISRRMNRTPPITGETENGTSETDPPDQNGGIPVATRMNDVRFRKMVRPGETIRIRCELTERMKNAFFMRAKVTVNGEVAVRFSFACAAVIPPE